MDKRKLSGSVCVTFYLCFIILISEVKGGRVVEHHQSLQDSGENLGKSEQSEVSTSDVTFEELNSTSGVRQPKYAFSLQNMPADGMFRLGNFSFINGVNATQPFGPFDPITSTLLVTKGALLAMLSAAKAILPPVVLVSAVALFIAVAAAFLICSTTECGGVGAGGDIFRRNSYEHDYDKYRPIYQAIDEYKYNHLNHHDKEY